MDRTAFTTGVASDEGRVSAITSLSETVKDLTSKLDALKQDKLRKWKWSKEALSIVAKLQDLASTNLPLVRSRLDKALEFPSAEWTNTPLFTGGKFGFEQFNRTPEWFDEMGFLVQRTAYTFSDTWDCAPITATFLVPTNLDTRNAKKLKIVFYFHGGGFCTGAGDFVSWYSRSSVEFARANNAIIIAPDYPLGPEASYRDISNAIKTFLIWYNEGGCFEPGNFTHWKQWLSTVTAMDFTNLQPQINDILIEGESAGGHAAVTAMFANAEKKIEHTNPWACDLPIAAVFLRYPMVKHYARECPDSVTYMNSEFTRAEVQKHAQDIKDAIVELEAFELVPSRSRSHPPHGMSAAFLLSITKEWQAMFQRHAVNGNDIDAAMDCLERVEAYVGKVDTVLPRIIMYHGDKDSNCPIDETRRFCDLLIQNYPEIYTENDTLIFQSVGSLAVQATWIKEMGRLEARAVDTVAHGFDYDLIPRNEEFLRKTYRIIGKWWL
ncbi:hypothetical protein IAQ61_010825 [Plenodomus lingam]|uniref:Alpha/beta hydrolase fold-3 domain-containing protein n=1 Tax=Leptosphaeria maculans (strain JN3 / isolate v23.1.3 / race Av1-4-5-6-7-8) TaxID=985895 RepID=E4ZJ48_LEPMJ|nr:hypothetical protein LEMA_P069870.1 [Plenodomus lingam JN3]KAH9861089.1 hypothetical protein IAQ61_010825 [Plenodomus lingam]CBX91479.1 hypothetical protein LEMA_P069870.1 [Plenodomus lingam JN3]